jgi:hypothetical protein
MNAARTLYQKLWDDHCIEDFGDGRAFGCSLGNPRRLPAYVANINAPPAIMDRLDAFAADYDQREARPADAEGMN